MHILISRSDHRLFEVDRLGAASWRAGGDSSELVVVALSTAAALATSEAASAGLALTDVPHVELARCGAAAEARVDPHGDPPRGALDFALLERAAIQGLLVLAVFCGIQVLNVFNVGTVIQDLGRAGKPGNQVSESKDHSAHAVTRCGPVGGCRLGGCPGELRVDSRHHQAFGQLAGSFEVVAVVPDGVLEAVDARDDTRFVLDVQRSPVDLTQSEHTAMCRAIRTACLGRHHVCGERLPAAGVL